MPYVQFADDGITVIGMFANPQDFAKIFLPDTDPAVQAFLHPIPVYTCRVWQIKAVLTPAQLIQVDAAIAALNNPAVTQFYTQGDNAIPSNSTTLLALGVAIGLTPAEIVTLVQTASTIVIP